MYLYLSTFAFKNNSIKYLNLVVFFFVFLSVNTLSVNSFQLLSFWCFTVLHSPPTLSRSVALLIKLIKINDGSILVVVERVDLMKCVYKRN